MNFGQIARYALNRGALPFDAYHLEQAKEELNFIVQDLWYKVTAEFRIAYDSISTVSGINQYVLNKFFDRLVKNSFQGSSTRQHFFSYLTPEEFYRRIQAQNDSAGDPYVYSFGQVLGYDTQLTAASRVKAFSGLASSITGSVNVVNGDDRIKSSASIFTINHVGLRFRRDGDSKTYKIGKFISGTELQLTEKYRGITGSSVNYKIGDVGIKVNVTGYVSGELMSEEAELDGIAEVVTANTFTTINSISKSDRTGGRITVQNEAGSNTLGVMAPGETVIERQSILLWPNPTGIEALTYSFYMHHPYLWLDTDRILIPKRYESLIAYKLTARILELTGQTVPPLFLADLLRKQGQFDNDSEDSSLMDAVPEDDTDQGIRINRYFDKLV